MDEKLIRRTFKRNGTYIDEEADPVCGENFCEQCGDCLVCFSEDSCVCNDPEDGGNGGHSWIEYEIGYKH